MSNLTARALSGTLYVAVFVACILLHHISYFFLFVLVTSLCLDEFNRILSDHNIAYPNNLVTQITGIFLFIATFLYSSGLSSTIAVFSPCLLSLLYLIISELYLKRENPLADWAFSFAGLLYIALPFSLLNLLAFVPGQGYSPLFPLSIFIFLWINDSGAYVFGSLLHKRFPAPLFKRISPHKSWVGSIGGGITVLAAALAIHFLTQTSTPWYWMGLGLTVVVFGSFGDLVESLLKRQLGLKESGRFLPGHGGVLDRFDSALLAIPAATIYIYFLNFTL